LRSFSRADAALRPIASRATRFAVIAAIGCLGALDPAAASAQTSLQIPLQFDFLNPGAKSLALAGAFAGLADDATASFANPAGLTQLDQSEFSIEGRYNHITTQFLQGGRLSGPVQNIGVDTVAGPVFGDSSGNHLGLGFASGVYRNRAHGWVIAAYRHELVRVDQTFLSQGVFQVSPDGSVSARDVPQLGVRSVSVTGYGAAAAYRPLPSLSVGAGVAAYSFTIDSRFTRYPEDGFFGPPNLGIVPQPRPATQTGDDTAVAPTVGAMFGRDRLRAGIVYRRGPTFNFTTTYGSGLQRQTAFRVPDTLAFGASFRIHPTLLVAGEVTRVTYSRLVNGFVTDQVLESDLALQSDHQAGFSIDDGTEVHAGIQYLAIDTRGTPRLRAGAWFDPDHSVHYHPTRPPASLPDALFDERFPVALSTGRNQVHWTGGIGLTLSAHVELNAAADIAPRNKLFSTSFIVR
jgi:long-chain fatty acid transport protein